MLVIDTVVMKFCEHCGVRVLVVNRDFSLIDDHRRRNHPERRRPRAPRR